MKDAANFLPKDIDAVYSDRPKCLLTLLWQWSDPSHILGRGELFGINKGDPRRTIFSSIYNLAPLQRDIHGGPHRDHRYMRLLLLELCEEKVREAIRDGKYEKTPIDEDFLMFRDSWIQKQQ